MSRASRAGDCATNGMEPVRSCAALTPSDHKSDDGPAGSPRNTSGAMYASVPAMSFTEQRRARPGPPMPKPPAHHAAAPAHRPASPSCFIARPKSTALMHSPRSRWPPPPAVDDAEATRKLPGLTSRCTKPHECTCASAAAICATTRAAVRSPSRPPPSAALRSPAAHSSITMHTNAASSYTASSDTTLGCPLSCRSAMTSSRSAHAACSAVSVCLGTILTANGRPSERRTQRYVVPLEPRPSSCPGR
mmetsp:Transcript_42880/g.128695  ORF Transcript_42880/g.128695 Transcript_42880/m.128695 type:complete len:248 (-) Transcript_42880:551-1294(-)